MQAGLLKAQVGKAFSTHLSRAEAQTVAPIVEASVGCHYSSSPWLGQTAAPGLRRNLRSVPRWLRSPQQQRCLTVTRCTAAAEPNRSLAATSTTASEAARPSAPTQSQPRYGSSSPTSSSNAIQGNAIQGIFTTRCGNSWRVRPYDNSDYGAIVDVQTDSFHTSNPVPFLHDFTYKLFRAEVVDALKQKTKYSNPAAFQLLVAEEATADETSAACTAAPADTAAAAAAPTATATKEVVVSSGSHSCNNGVDAVALKSSSANGTEAATAGSSSSGGSTCSDNSSGNNGCSHTHSANGSSMSSDRGIHSCGGGSGSAAATAATAVPPHKSTTSATLTVASTSTSVSNSHQHCSNTGREVAGAVEVSLMSDRAVLRVLPRTPAQRPPPPAPSSAPNPTQPTAPATTPTAASSSPPPSTSQSQSPSSPSPSPSTPASEYAYISSMCVQGSMRRRGVAQALMAAAEAQARAWGQAHLALHVYEDNAAAVQLYRSFGMQVLSDESGWVWRALLGGRKRLLMHKGL